MKSELGPPPPLEKLRRLDEVEPRSELVTLLLEVAREETSPPFVDDPDISLKRLVVPRVAPMLELGVFDVAVGELVVLELPALGVVALDVVLLGVATVVVEEEEELE